MSILCYVPVAKNLNYSINPLETRVFMTNYLQFFDHDQHFTSSDISSMSFSISEANASELLKKLEEMLNNTSMS